MMQMAFGVGRDISNFLFKGINITTSAELGAAIVCIGILGLLLEVLKATRAYLVESIGSGSKSNCNSSSSRTSRAKYSAISETSPTPPCTKKSLVYLHLLQTAMTIIQLFFGYILMLAVMYYNAWIFVAVILGSAIGYYIAGIFIQHPFMSKEVNLDESPNCCDMEHVPSSSSSGSQNNIDSGSNEIKC